MVTSVRASKISKDVASFWTGTHPESVRSSEPASLFPGAVLDVLADCAGVTTGEGHRDLVLVWAMAVGRSTTLLRTRH